jgi:hypothetical protein
MPIPKLRKDGWLPVGIHDCTLEEIEKHFGRFKRTDRRIQLFEKLQQLVRDAWQTGFVKEFFIDGSFTSAKDEPGDIDLIIVLDPTTYLDPNNEMTFADELALSHDRLKKRYRFDAFDLLDQSEEYFKKLKLFCTIRNTESKKGILRLRL